MLNMVFGFIWTFKAPLFIAAIIWWLVKDDPTSWFLQNPGNIIVPAFILWALFKFVGALIGGGSD